MHFFFWVLLKGLKELRWSHRGFRIQGFYVRRGGADYVIFRWNEWKQRTSDIPDTKTTSALIPCIKALSSIWYCVEGTVTRFCACAATWFLFQRTVFQDWRLVKKSSSIDPETSEKAIISVFKSYLVHLGSFKRHILYFCASIVEKIQSHWGEPYEAKFVVVSVPRNGSNVAFNVVIWLSFLSVKVLQSTIYLWRTFFKR